jgi:hypothetical protein
MPDFATFCLIINQGGIEIQTGYCKDYCEFCTGLSVILVNRKIFFHRCLFIMHLSEDLVQCAVLLVET